MPFKVLSGGISRSFSVSAGVMRKNGAQGAPYITKRRNERESEGFSLFAFFPINV